MEMTLEVIQKEGPLWRTPPPITPALAIEIDRKRGDQIKLPFEIGERLERSDGPQPALDSEELQQSREEWEFIDIQTEPSVTEVLENEEKKAAAAAEIEHGFRRASVQVEILRPDNIQAEPPFHICIFCVVLG
jgi:hypothetical protein